MTREEALQQLRDIRGMDASWWQALLEWLLLIAGMLIMLAITAMLARWCYRQWQETRQKKQQNQLADAMAQCASIQQPDRDAVATVFALLRQWAILQSSRQHIAHLEGDAWLEWLDTANTNDKPLFSWRHEGRALLAALYAPPHQPIDREMFQRAVAEATRMITMEEKA